jgi:hypothetical protein
MGLSGCSQSRLPLCDHLHGDREHGVQEEELDANAYDPADEALGELDASNATESSKSLGREFFRAPTELLDFR